MKRNALGLILLLIFNVLLLNSCARNPVSHEDQFVVLSEQDELQIGQQGDLQIKTYFGVYADPILGAYVDSVGQKIAEMSARPNIPYYFTILDTDMVNAFALPGGYVYVTRGLLAKLNSEAELANVIAHEVTHVAARHAVQQISKSYGYELAWVGAGILLQQNINRWKQLADLGVQIVLLGYSRENELESDQQGINYAYKAGYDPNAMAAFLTTLEAEERRGDEPPKWLSTHPATEERIKKLNEDAAQLIAGAATASLIVRADEYKDKINGIKLGPGQNTGEVNGRQYKNKYYGFRINAPKKWLIDRDNTNTLVEFSDPDRKFAVFVQAMFLTETMNVTAWVNLVEKGLPENTNKISSSTPNGTVPVYSSSYERPKDKKIISERRDFLLRDKYGFVVTYLAPKDKLSEAGSSFQDIYESIAFLSAEEIKKSFSQYLVVYTVRAGDTLNSIATQYELKRPADLTEFNGLTQNALLYNEERLKIPPQAQ